MPPRKERSLLPQSHLAAAPSCRGPATSLRLRERAPVWLLRCRADRRRPAGVPNGRRRRPAREAIPRSVVANDILLVRTETRLALETWLRRAYAVPCRRRLPSRYRHSPDLTKYIHGRMEDEGICQSRLFAVLVVPAIAAAKDYGCDEVNWGEDVLEGLSEREQGLPVGHDEERSAVRQVRWRSSERERQ